MTERSGFIENEKSGGAGQSRAVGLFLLKRFDEAAVPMAARVADRVAKESDPTNFILMHAMGPNVSGVIGSAVAAGILLVMCG